MSYNREEYVNIMQEFIHYSMYESHASSLLQKFMRFSNIMGDILDFGRQQCDGMLKNNQLMAALQDAKFDVILQDPLAMCGDLVADMLSVPLVLSLRLSFGSVMERHCGHAPAPPSYVPLAPLPYSDRMMFMERLTNMVTYVASSLLTELAWKLSLDNYYSEIKG